MSAAPVTTPALLSPEEFAQRPDPGYPEELVRERSCVGAPKARHGEICSRVCRFWHRAGLTWVACSATTPA